MANLTDPSVAAMSQQAHQILSNAGTAQTVQGLQQIPGLPQGGGGVPQMPTTLLANRVDQIGGGDPNAALYAALRATPASFTPQGLQARYAAAQAAQAASDADALGGNSMADFTRGYFANTGYQGSDEALRALAQQYAPSYGGQTFAAHNIAQEGQVTYQNGVPGIMVKYTAPGQGSDTRWVPLQ